MHKTQTVGKEEKLLSFLFLAWPAEKKKQIRTWLKHQAVTVNGRVVTQFDHPLNIGDVVAIHTGKEAAPGAVIGEGLQVQFEDDSLIIVDKPANLLTIASESEQEKTAYFQLTSHLRRGNRNSRDRVWVVHRLDRETSGLLVFAKTPHAKRQLQEGWGDYEKRYMAVVEGSLSKEKGVFESWLDESNPVRVWSAPRSEVTRHAITHYRVLKRKKAVTLVELSLETGRRHQIRVHLADAGCPVVGDSKYGARTNPARRLGLHACMLRFVHPVTRKEMRFESPFPAELARLV